MITHYQRILNYIKPDYVHVFVDGRIVEEGGPELAHKLEAEGYEAFMPDPVGGGSVMSSHRDRGRQPRSATTNKYGFHDAEDYFFKSGRGLSPELVAAISEHKNEPEWMRKFRLQGARVLPRAAAPDVGRRTSPRSTSRTSTTTSSRPRSRRSPGRTCPPTSRTPGTSSASPRRSRSTSPASAPSTSPRSSTTSSRRSLEKQGVLFLDMDSGCASTRTSSSSTSARSSRRTTTSSRRSTRPSGRAARSSTCRRA